MKLVISLSGTLICIAFGTGCTIPIEYGARPLPPPATSQAEACYHDNRMEVSTGSASVEWSATVGIDWIVFGRDSVAGLAFYKGGERLSPARALRELRDVELEATYQDTLGELARGRSIGYRRSLTGGAVALGSLAVGTVAVFGDEVNTPLLVAAGVGYVAGLFYALSAWKYREHRQRYAIYQGLFVEKALSDRLGFAILRYNRQAAERCGYRGPVDIPMPSELANKAPETYRRVDHRKPEAVHPDGTHGGRCYGNGTCNAGLDCANDTCVPVRAPQPHQ